MDGNVEFQLDKQRKLLYRRMVVVQQESKINGFCPPTFYPLRRYQIPRGIPSAGALNTRVCVKILRFSTEIAVYLGNGTR